jgi:hypothetical protein
MNSRLQRAEALGGEGMMPLYYLKKAFWPHEAGEIQYQKKTTTTTLFDCTPTSSMFSSCP